MARESTTFSSTRRACAPAGDVAAAARALPSTGAQDEVVELCRDLIRIDTSQLGDRTRARGAARRPSTSPRSSPRWASSRQIFESQPGRASVVARIEGEDPAAPALLIHGHLDVVPADADDWTHRPVRRRDRRRLRVGPRRGRHEGHGRDDARGRPRPRCAAAASRRATSCSPSSPTRRPAARSARSWLVDNHAGPVRGLHRGDQRGRRLLLHGQRRSAALPDRDGREGHGLDAADRRRPRRPRLDDQRRQRGHRSCAEAVARIGRHRFPVG